MSRMNFESNPVLLLTGAGFSHNFGTPLARDMWAWIFNQKGIQKQPRLKNLLLNDFDFESVALKVRAGDFAEEEKEAIEEALKFAYLALDEILIGWKSGVGGSSPLNIYGFQEFLTRFSENSRRRGKKGFLFTLNQDLLLERHYYSFSAPGKVANRPQILGLSHRRGWFESNFTKPLHKDDYCVLPSEDKLNAAVDSQLTHGSFFYVKLHGSHNWLSDDGRPQMVIGDDKSGQINNHPLLAKYFEIFKEVISQPDRRLLVCGYGFRDKHINVLIKKAIVGNGLQVYILSPQSPSDLKQTLEDEQDEEIWDGLSGYFPFTLKQLFPPDQSKTREVNLITQLFFERRI